MTLPGCVERDVSLSRLTTVGTGGPARFFGRPESVAELAGLLAWRADEGLAMAVVGLGSNLLASDEGFDGLVVRLSGGLAEIERDGDSIRCGGGASLAAVVKRATSGVSRASSSAVPIPGRLWAAPCGMNAGAYGGEMRDVLADALVLRPEAAATAAPSSWP